MDPKKYRLSIFSFTSVRETLKKKTSMSQCSVSGNHRKTRKILPLIPEIVVCGKQPFDLVSRSIYTLTVDFNQIEHFFCSMKKHFKI